ncbi:glycosyltransferase family 9 protein [Flectobacillus longus]|uniref:glycosyltransferase family 9 protein n=1 Tax=Flectobacillus longus TaxID=2984207 RepID=UPI0024B70F8D|nr:glycosyltransferase family 9 protein [Flectobacillus longus]MDI9878459.1 glycosyltransferase family 9 protein [Flectobacillus longus]
MPQTKFLILRFSSIGDIVLTTPVIRCIKQQYPDAQVHFATKKSYQSLLNNNPYVDKTHLLESSLSTFVDELKAEQFDYVIDLHNNLRTRIIKFRLGVKSFSFDKLNFRKWVLVKFKKNLMPNIHIVDRYLATTATLGIKNDNKGLDYFIPEKDQLPTDWLPEEYRKGFVVYAIGGQHATKKLPVTKIIEVCQEVSHPIILIGGPEDKTEAEQVVEALKGKFILNTCGNCNLNQSASLIQQSLWVISHDTGMMHVAAALKKKVVSIWGNTVPEFGMYPYQTPFIAIENKEIECRPCSKIGFEKCPLGHFKCVNDLEFSDLEKKIFKTNYTS